MSCSYSFLGFQPPSEEMDFVFFIGLVISRFMLSGNPNFCRGSPNPNHIFEVVSFASLRPEDSFQIVGNITGHATEKRKASSGFCGGCLQWVNILKFPLGGTKENGVIDECSINFSAKT
jgi:hypothetical protein